MFSGGIERNQKSYLEAGICRSSLKQVLLKISQISQENVSLKRVSLIKFHVTSRNGDRKAWRPVVLLKRGPNTGVFLWNLQKKFKSTFFTEHLRWLVLSIWFLEFNKHKGNYWNYLKKNISLKNENVIALNFVIVFIIFSFEMTGWM